MRTIPREWLVKPNYRFFPFGLPGRLPLDFFPLGRGLPLGDPGRELPERGPPDRAPEGREPLGREPGRSFAGPPNPALGLEPPVRDLEAKGFGFEP